MESCRKRLCREHQAPIVVQTIVQPIVQTIIVQSTPFYTQKTSSRMIVGSVTSGRRVRVCIRRAKRPTRFAPPLINPRIKMTRDIFGRLRARGTCKQTHAQVSRARDTCMHTHILRYMFAHTHLSQAATARKMPPTLFPPPFLTSPSIPTQSPAPPVSGLWGTLLSLPDPRSLLY